MTMLYKHKKRPEWGAAQLIAEANGKRTFLFADHTQRTFPESHWNLMEPVGGEATETAPAAPSTAGAPGANDMRALAKHTQILDDSGPAPSYREKLTEEPETGTYGNVGYSARDRCARSSTPTRPSFACTGTARTPRKG